MILWNESNVLPFPLHPSSPLTLSTSSCHHKHLALSPSSNGVPSLSSLLLREIARRHDLSPYSRWWMKRLQEWLDCKGEIIATFPPFLSLTPEHPSLIASKCMQCNGLFAHLSIWIHNPFVPSSLHPSLISSIAQKEGGWQNRHRPSVSITSSQFPPRFQPQAKCERIFPKFALHLLVNISSERELHPLHSRESETEPTKDIEFRLMDPA